MYKSLTISYSSLKEKSLLSLIAECQSGEFTGTILLCLWYSKAGNQIVDSHALVSAFAVVCVQRFFFLLAMTNFLSNVPFTWASVWSVLYIA